MSVKNQTYQGFECLVVDDGSSLMAPGTQQLQAEVIFRASVGMDGRFSFFRQSNQGVSAARNTGIRRACGRHVVFLDADDWLEPNYLEEAFLHIIDDPTQIYYAPIKIDLKGELLPFEACMRFVPQTNNLLTLMLGQILAMMPVNYFWRTDFLQRNQLFFKESLSTGGQDIAFNISAFLAAVGADPSIGRKKAIPLNSHYIYRRHERQRSLHPAFSEKMYRSLSDFFRSRQRDFQAISVLHGCCNRFVVAKLLVFSKWAGATNRIEKVGYAFLKKAFSLFTRILVRLTT